FDQIVKTLPDGVYLTGVSQTGDHLKFSGVAQSSTRVSAFMRNIDGSQWMKNPTLEVIQSSQGAFGSAFTLDAEESAEAADAGADGPAGRRIMAKAGEPQMNLSFLEELRDLDPRDPGRLPLAALVGAVAATFIVLTLFLIYFCVWQDVRPELQQKEAEEQSLRTEFQQKHARAVNLGVYKQQLRDLQRSFGALLRQLPGKTEVPN